MNQPINLRQAVKQNRLDDFLAQHTQEPVARDQQERFQQVLDSMVKGKTTDGEA